MTTNFHKHFFENSKYNFKYLSGGVLLAMITSLALPWRSVFNVCW